jgi:hypothetical protein
MSGTQWLYFVRGEAEYDLEALFKQPAVVNRQQRLAS